jgi:hypothetical protein
MERERSKTAKVVLCLVVIPCILGFMAVALELATSGMGPGDVPWVGLAVICALILSARLAQPLFQKLSEPLTDYEAAQETWARSVTTMGEMSPNDQLHVVVESARGILDALKREKESAESVQSRFLGTAKSLHEREHHPLQAWLQYVTSIAVLGLALGVAVTVGEGRWTRTATKAVLAFAGIWCFVALLYCYAAWLWGKLVGRVLAIVVGGAVCILSVLAFIRWAE